MKKFAFFPTNSLKKGYENILIKYRNQDAFMDLLKISALLFVLFFCVFIYLRYVSLSSTHGYFLRRENQKLSNASFQYEIFKTQLLDQRKKNREKINTASTQRREVVSVTTEVVVVPILTEVSVNQ